MFIGSHINGLEIKEAVSNHLWMRLHAKPTDKVKDQVEKIKVAISTLPNEFQDIHFEAILEWEKTFFSTYDIESRLDSDKEEAAHSILFLIFNNIDYIMGSCSSKKEMVKWQLIKNELNAIVKTILPSHRNVEEFTKASKQKYEEALLRYQFGMKILEFKNKTAKLFEQLEEQWYESADRMNNLEIEFEGIKAMLIDWHTQRQVAVESLHKEIDLLTSTTLQIFRAQGMQLSEAQELGKKISTQQKLTNQLLDRCEALIDGK